MAFTPYTAGNEKRWKYRREYKGNQLRKGGFLTKGQAEASLRRAMAEVDNPTELKPTTLQDALDAYREHLLSHSDRKDKSVAYRHGVTSLLNKLQTFVDGFGPKRPVREVQKIHLSNWYVSLRDSETVSQASAASHLGRLGGMLKHAQINMPDLATWNRPRFNEKPNLVNPGRTVSAEEYKALLEALAAPKSCKRIADRAKLWREAHDAVRLLRNTGARLNEILRLNLSQIDLEGRKLTIYSTKTDKSRTIPLSSAACDVVEGRIRDGLTDGVRLFARSTKPHFDGDIESACRDAAAFAGLTYGRKTPGGFTLHGFRHSYITELLSAGVDIPTVMTYSGHKSLATFSVYLHSTNVGEQQALQRIELFG